MGLQTFVKVGEITNLSDARYCAGMGVELLGFNVIENTAGFVDPEKFAEITGWVVGVSYCAEINDFFPNRNLLESLNNANITYIESTSLDVLKNLTGFLKIHKTIIKTQEDIDALFNLVKEISSIADFLLVECEKEALFAKIDHLLSEIKISANIIKSYGLTEGNVINLDQSIFHGIALKGSEEIKPGYKDFDELAEILEALEVD